MLFAFYGGIYVMESMTQYIKKHEFCSMSTVYTTLCRGPKYLLKVRYIILVYPNVTRFLIFKVFCLGRSKTLPYVWKKHYKNWRYLCLLKHIFTKLSQNVCLIDIHISMHWFAKCNCKLWKLHQFYWLYRVFSYIFHVWIAVSSPNFDRLCV